MEHRTRAVQPGVSEALWLFVSVSEEAEHFAHMLCEDRARREQPPVLHVRNFARPRPPRSRAPWPVAFNSHVTQPSPHTPHSINTQRPLTLTISQRKPTKLARRAHSQIAAAAWR